ncbi:MAG: SAM-dependent methyltransferase [Candidatus Helarchaeales archaeon]
MKRKRWIEKRKADPFYRKSKKDGFSSRAAYKLAQLKKFHVFRGAKVVIDLCSSPGSWIEYLLKETEVDFILGVDLNKIPRIESEKVHFIKGDITKPEIMIEIKNRIPRLADLVLSDCSQKHTGIHATDHARQLYLAECSFRIASVCLRPGGIFVTKIFQGDLLKGFIDTVRKDFFSTRLFKPEASLKSSPELYLLAFGKKATNS